MIVKLLYSLQKEMEKKEKKSDLLYGMIIFGGIIGGWCALLGSIVQFIIDGINYFS